MRLNIAAIGNGRNAAEQSLALDWLNRLPFRGQLNEFTSRKPAGPARCLDESTRILSSLPDGALLIALDPGGKDTSSEAMAALIRRYRDDGRRDAVFAIGGADGHHPDLIARADHVIAFGRQTWPHMLFRAMLAEQLYRAEMILAGHPYHHA
ncbi:MAG: 23S rRNA (pseudouridine(1915)-N(3))-methyltransferase RlmH [SAR116 cluster bacterium MED-G04]|jgi:23S rRNA (pseudouridine1915-N3)-methyltransferase|nr:23S rRNA (pseudouridine(1915)-N(3))-methyltransferase RlmH [SAR116 cluster bacterium]OUW37620.1 MAG: hypothetical protein CBD43_00810 [Gammaproteobacteria bacterium TMED183]PDH64137.1 MAG: 23S rRNA (pseudouridine(1915)-N(3))-methyltransferase RlmH [SAR116 cluster bacterium MED-G04]HCD50340.1 23S rRNA (pseudouridine(1915)-N(3))-methyltransferase RlmH [Alphaproteobacteria bacterium]CAI8380479.1 MAG: Ribosomal RNA large subunit methyltransferase H [SAR116 cluster bacterium MED-G04]|tara:strand:- start:9419 stop:9874 length:456 start_codon:yes stop_codon:yes gene_type:complete